MLGANFMRMAISAERLIIISAMQSNQNGKGTKMATSDYLKRCKQLRDENNAAGKRTVYTSPTGGRLIDHAERLEHEVERLKAQLAWVNVEDCLPDLSALADTQSGVEVIVETERGGVMAAKFCRNAFARTEKGRRPRWERNGRIFESNVLRWKPLPPGSGK